MARLFVSYRRSDADTDAGRIADRLVEAFGEDAVFHDHETLQAGVPWRPQIDQALDDTEVTLVVIGPGWLNAQGRDGQRRLDDPEDMVAYEVARSIERRIRIIPLLVRDATLPEPAALPARLQALPGYQGHKLRNDTFKSDMDRLIVVLGGSRRRAGLWAGAAAAGALAAGAAAWALWPTPPQPTAPTAPVVAAPTQPAPASATTATTSAGTLGLRIELDAGGEPMSPAQRFLLSLREPVKLPKIELPEPRSLGQGLVEVVAEDTLLPGRGERYEADVRRQPLSASISTSARHGRTSVCLQRTDTAPTTPLRAVVRCVEGEHCTLDAENPGHFTVCGQRVGQGQPGWSWIGTAHAQTPTAATWVVPSLETLQRQRQAGTGPAYTEVLLESPPLPQFAAARSVSVKVTVNDREALIDGLPADASAVPFDASRGLKIGFGLENLDFAGADKGHDSVALVLRFMDGAGRADEVRSTLRYIALRDQPEPRPVGEPALGIRWTARYHPGRAEDRFQVFVTSSEDVEALVRAKQALDAAGHVATIGGRSYPLVGVVRPPLGDNRAWGLNIGLRLPSGQIRFTFDETVSTQVCRRAAELATGGDRQIRRDSYRRSVDNTRQYKTCVSFSPG